MSHFVECVGGRMVLPVLSVRFATRETLRGQEAATAADTHQKKKSFTYGAGALVEKTLGFSNQLVA
jgi:hypothetical protein